jgi:hypothetical protein
VRAKGSREPRNSAPTVRQRGLKSGNGKTGAVDEKLAEVYGGRPATWHGRRCGRDAVNKLAAAIIETWRGSGDQEELAVWIRPIEAAIEGIQPGLESARFRAAMTDAVEDEAEAKFYEDPCEATARILIRKRAADRRASLEHDQELAAEYGIQL